MADNTEYGLTDADNLGVHKVPPPGTPGVAADPAGSVPEGSQTSSTALPEGFEAVEPSEPGLPAGFESVREATQDEVQVFNDKRLEEDVRYLWEKSIGGNPEEKAQVLEIARYTGTKSSIVEASLPAFKARMEAANGDIPKFIRDNRKSLIRDLIERPELAQVYMKDEKISKLWLALKGITSVLDYAMELDPGGGSPEELRANFEARQKSGEEIPLPPSKESIFPAPRKVPTIDDPQSGLAMYGAAWDQDRKASTLNSLTTKRAILAAIGKDTYEIDKQRVDLQSELAISHDYKPSAIGGIVLDAEQTASSILDSYKGAAEVGGIPAAVAAAGTLALTRSPTAARKVAKIVWKVGAPVGAFLGGFEQEFGNIHNSLLADPEVAKDMELAFGMSAIYAAAASTIEVGVDLGPVMRMFGPLGDMIAKGEGQAYMKALLRDRTFRNIFKDAGKRWMRGVKGESLEEGVQQILQGMSEWGAAYLARRNAVDVEGSSLPLPEFPTEKILQEAVGATEQAARGMGALGVTGFTSTVLQNALRRDSSLRAGERAAAIIQFTKEDSPTLKAAPDFVAKHIAEETEESGERVSHLYVDAKQFKVLLQDGNADAGAAAKELLGPDGDQKLEEALATGQKLEVPVEDYLTKWGNKPIAEALQEHTTTRADHLTPAQLKNEIQQKEVERQAKELADKEEKTQEKAKPFEQIMETLEEGLLATGKYEEKDIPAMALAWRKIIETRAAKTKEDKYEIAKTYIPKIAATIGITPEEFVNSLQAKQTVAVEAQEPSGPKSPGFKNLVTGKIYPTIGFHDLGQLLDQLSPEEQDKMMDMLETPDYAKNWAEGYVDHDEKFLTREENKSKYGGKGISTDYFSQESIEPGTKLYVPVPESDPMEVNYISGQGTGVLVVQAPKTGQVFRIEESEATDKDGKTLPVQGLAAPDTEKFKEWFGKSKVVDSDGKPLVQFHGTDRAFDVFRKSADMGSHFGTIAAAEFRLQMIADFRQTIFEDPSSGAAVVDNAQIYPVFLRIEHPLDLPDMGSWIPGDIASLLSGYAGMTAEEAAMSYAPLSYREKYKANPVLTKEETEKVKSRAHREVAMQELLLVLRRKGYDGVKYRNTVEAPGSISWITFSPSQAKSVFNKGEFNIQRGSILEQGDIPANDMVPANEEMVQEEYEPELNEEEREKANADFIRRREQQEKNWAPIRDEIHKFAHKLYRELEMDGGGSGRIDPGSLGTRIIDAAIRKENVPTDVNMDALVYGQESGDSTTEQDKYPLTHEALNLAFDSVDEDKIAFLERITGLKQVEGGSLISHQSKADLKILEQGPFDLTKIPRGFVVKIKDAIVKAYHLVVTEKADLSTFLHESSHIFLDVLGDAAELPQSQAAVKEDWANTLKWMGVKDRNEIKREHEEKWAKAFEKYLLKGEAPSAALAGAFQRYKLWLKQVYKNVFGAYFADINVDPVITGVFDRMFATDREIERMKATLGLRPFFRSPAEAGMNEVQWQAYLDAQSLGLSKGAQQAEKKALKDALRVTEDWWKRELGKETEEALKEYDKQPAYRAWKLIRSGKFTDEKGATTEPELDKLDMDTVTKIVGEKDAKRFVGRIQKKGLDPNIMAQMFHFESGEEMLKAILALPPREETARQVATDRMNEKHPDILADRQRLSEMVAREMHNPMTLDSLLKEWKALRSKSVQGPGGVPIEAIKMAAKLLAGRMAIGKLKPQRILSAERDACDNAFLASVKGDYASAYIFKQQQILNYFLYQEVLKGRDRRDKFKDVIKNMNSTERRGQLYKAGQELQNVSDAVLEAIGARPMAPPEEVAQRLGMDMLIQRFYAELTQPAFDEEKIKLLLVKPVEAKNLTLADMDNIANLFSQIKQIASATNKVLLNQKRETIRNVVEQIGLEAEAEPDRGGLPISDSAMERSYWTKQNFSGVNASMADPEMLFKRLGKTAYTFFWRRYIDRRNFEDKLAANILVWFDKHWNELPAEMQSKRFDLIDAHELPMPEGLNMEGPRDRQWLWMLFLNMGNQSNLDRLLGGYKWEEKQLFDWIQGKLTREEVNFLTGIWELMDEKLYPEVAEVYRQVNGVVPPKIPAKPFQMKLANGEEITVRGGYFPARYKAGVSTVGQKVDAQAVENMDRAFPGASVMKSFTFGRKKNYKDVLDLNWHVFPSHVSEVIHYLAFDQFVRDANRVLHSPDWQEDLEGGDHIYHTGMRTIVQRRLGEEYRFQLEQWLRVVATARADSVPRYLSKWLSAIGWGRSRFVMSTIGYSLGVAMGDLPTVFTAVTSGKVKMRYFAPAFIQTLIHGPSTYAKNKKLSKELSHRSGLIEGESWWKTSQVYKKRLMKDLGTVGKAGKFPIWDKPLEAVRDMAWYFMEHTDRLVANAIFEAGYRQGLATNNNEVDAIEEADGIVRGLLPSHDVAEQPAFLRDKRSIGALLAFYGYFLKQYNVLREVWHPVWIQWQEAEGLTEKGKAIAWPATKAAGYTLATLFVTNVLGELLSGRGPDDDEDWEEWMLRKMLASPWLMVPFIGSTGEALTYKLVSGKWRKVSVRAAPATAALQRIYEGLEKAGRSKNTSDKVWASLDALLTATNLPASQVAKTGKYVNGLLDGSVRPDEPFEVVGGIIYGKKKEQPTNIFTIQDRRR